MKQKNENIQKKTIKLNTLLVVFFLLMFAFGANKGLFADPVCATIVDRDLEGALHQYFIDRDGDGFEDASIRIHSSNGSVPSLFKRYMLVGGRVLYENEGRDDFYISMGQVIRIEMPDGRLIKVVDIVGPNAMGYDYARAYEAKQAQAGH